MQRPNTRPIRFLPARKLRCRAVTHLPNTDEAPQRGVERLCYQLTSVPTLSH